MLTKNKRIAIIGGGPGGLTLARLLQLNGVDVTVYERDLNRDVRVQGATLDLHAESGLAALEAARLMDAFKANYRPGADKMRITDKDAHVLYDQHEAVSNNTFGDEHFRPEIDRGPLRNMLLDSLQPGTVIWDSRIASLTPDTEGWQLQFTNGATVYADIVIGADGANSSVRPFVTDIKPFYSGMTVIEGTVYRAAENAPRVYELLKDGKIFALGDEKTLIVSSKGDGSMSFYTGCKMPESWLQDSGIDLNNNDQLLEWFRQEFAGWSDVWYELFRNGQTCFVARPQYYMPPNQTWAAQNNITLLGDAAHLMPPYAGEGVNMAMQDALELSQRLAGNFATIQEAIAAYEMQMRKRSSEMITLTLEQTERMHSPDALQYMLDFFSQD